MTDEAKVLTRLARAVADRNSKQPLTSRLCEACRQVLSADGAAITVDGLSVNRLTVAATSDLSARLEDVQEVLGQGPGYDAYSTGAPVILVVGDEARSRWPLFVDEVEPFAASAKLWALPMRPNGTVLGVLTLVNQGGRSLGEDLGIAQFLSDAVGAALLRDPLSQANFGEGGPWSQRAEIHQATGMVAAQLRIGPEDAIALLKAHAYAHDLDLAGVAHLIAERKLDFSVGD
jgi:hypothetical protein